MYRVGVFYGGNFKLTMTIKEVKFKLPMSKLVTDNLHRSAGCV